MENVRATPEKINSTRPFRTWDGRLIVAVPCGGWRHARPLDLALLPPSTWQLVITRQMEG